MGVCYLHLPSESSPLNLHRSIPPPHSTQHVKLIFRWPVCVTKKHENTKDQTSPFHHFCRFGKKGVWHLSSWHLSYLTETGFPGSPRGEPEQLLSRHRELRLAECT